MSDQEIKKAIQLARTAISKRINGRTQYSPPLKATLLRASEALGPTRFSKRSGVTQSLLYKWKQKSLQNTRQSPVKSAPSGPPVRELFVSPMPGISQTQFSASPPPQRAILHAGNELKFEVPLDWLTPDRISEVLRCVSAKRVKHA
jgi:transposase-like protein